VVGRSDYCTEFDEFGSLWFGFSWLGDLDYCTEFDWLPGRWEWDARYSLLF
jgi:hypothetical protein